MKISENTILITGGGSGIGFETAKLFSQLGNTVILAGRNEEKLKASARKLNHTHYIVPDVTKDDDVELFFDKINRNFKTMVAEAKIITQARSSNIRSILSNSSPTPNEAQSIKIPSRIFTSLGIEIPVLIFSIVFTGGK